MTLGTIIGRNRPAIIGVTMLLIGAGIWAAATLPVSIFPEVAFHRVSVIVRTGNLPVDQTLTVVTQPVENAVSGLLGLQTVRSLTTRGGVEMDLLFDWG